MTHASLFSGIGGAEVAASMMGWQNLFHCEIQEFPRKVLEYWFPQSESYEDITTTDFGKWKGKVDILTGGFPCQPFSCAGLRRGTDDDRYLWPEMLRAIREIQPTWVVGENVAGLATMVESCHATQMGRTDDLFEENYLYREESRYTLCNLCDNLSAEGYSVQPFIIPACAIGAPHRRDRLWIVAHRTDARTETMQQKGRNGILPVESTPHPGCHRQRQWQNEQEPVTRCEGTSNPRPFSPFGASSSSEHTRECAWQDFPTQSPVCGRDDGVSFDVDRLTIPFARWRKESIKAYGNAWVPQVAYEIFQAIEAVSI